MITIPPTRTHRQLAAWINSDPIASRRLRAEVEYSKSNTDRRVGRLRVPGRGRSGVRLVLYPRSHVSFRATTVLYIHDTSETYRKHKEAREWVEAFLNDRVPTIVGTRKTTTARAFVNERVANRKHLNRLGFHGRG